MKLSFDTQLMANYLPGGGVPAFERVEMMPTPDGRVVLFAIDSNGRFVVWVSSADGYTRWDEVSLRLPDGTEPTAIDFDVVGSTDGETFDVSVVTVAEGAAPERALYAFHAVSARADRASWERRFAEASPLPLEFLPIGARWSRLGGPARSLVARGVPQSGGVGIWWLSFDDAGLRAPVPISVPPGATTPEELQLLAANQRVNGVLVEGCFIVSPGVNERRRLVRYVTPARPGSPESVWPQRYLDGTYDGWGAVSSMRGAPWPDSGVTVAFFNVASDRPGESEVCFLNETAAIDGEHAALAKSSLSEYRPIPGPLHVDIERVDQHHIDHRFELVKPDAEDDSARFLRATVGSEASNASASSTLLAADVASFCACLCTDPRTLRATRHVLVGYTQGGVDLFTLDPESGLWQRYTVADDRLSAVHSVNSYAVQVRALNEDDGPLGSGAVSISVDTPCYALVQGRAMHLSTLTPAVIAVGPAGDTSIVLSQGSLAAPRLTLAFYPDVVVEPDAGLPFLPPSILDGQDISAILDLRPTDTPMDVLEDIPDGAAIRDAVASDGTQPFKDLSDETCDAAHAGLVKLTKGYRAASNATARPRADGSATPTRRLHFRGERGRVQSSEVAPEAPLPRALRLRPAGPRDVFDDIGNVFSYVWTQIDTPVDFYLDDASDGLIQFIVAIGDDYVSVIVDSAEAVAELTDWFLQHTLDVSLDDIVNWLGFVFDWESILRNKDSLTRIATLAVDYLKAQLVDVRPVIKETARYVDSLLADFPDLSPEVKASLSQPTDSRPKDTSAFGTAADGPSPQWGLQTIRSYAPASTVDVSGNPFDFARAIEQALLDQGEALTGLFDKLTAYADDTNLGERSVIGVFEDLVALVGSSAVSAGEVLALDAVDIIGKGLDAVDSVLDQRLDIPVLTALYETQLVPGGTLTGRDVSMLAASILATVAHKVAFDADLFTEAQRAAIEEATSFDELIRVLEGDLGSAGQPHFSPGGLIAIIAGVLKGVYVVYWTADQWYPYPPGSPKFIGLNIPKAIFDAFSWTLSTSMAAYRLHVVLDSNLTKEEINAAKLNVLALSLQTFNRLKDFGESVYILEEEVVPPELMEATRKVEAVLCGICTLVFDVALAAYVYQIPVEDCPPEYWYAMISLPVAHLAATSVHSFLAIGPFFSNPTRLRLLQVRTAVNTLRPLLGMSTGVAKLIGAESGYHFPGVVGE